MLKEVVEHKSDLNIPVNQSTDASMGVFNWSLSYFRKSLAVSKEVREGV